MPRGIPNKPREVTVNSGSPSVAVSDQARSDPNYKPQTRSTAPTPSVAPAPGQPYHASGFGALGTTDRPVRSALAYSTEVPAQQSVAPAQQMSAVADTSRNNEVATNTPSAPVTQASSPPQIEPDDRVAALEAQVSNLGTLLATVSAQLQQVGSVAPVLPGTANPAAPTPHVGSSVQGTVVPKVEGPVIPAPTKIDRYDETVPRLPNQAKVPTLLPGEEDLTQPEYIERHFRYRDLSIEQIAYMCHMEPTEVIDILKELGYQFVDGAS